MIAIVDYDAGNINSVQHALSRLGAEWTLTADPKEIIAADHVLLPGVGHAGHAVERLRQRGLDHVVRGLRQPVLGICVGMQILCSHTAEGDADGLDVFDCDVLRFQPLSPADKVPHTGWNTVTNLESKLFKGIPAGTYMYFVHSYYATLCCDTIATCRYGEGESMMFSAALKYENFYGTQFHPEKSGDAGEAMLANFIRL